MKEEEGSRKQPNRHPHTRTCHRETSGDVCQVSTSSWVSEKPNLVLCWPNSLCKASI